MQVTALARVYVDEIPEAANATRWTPVLTEEDLVPEEEEEPEIVVAEEEPEPKVLDDEPVPEPEEEKPSACSCF